MEFVGIPETYRSAWVFRNGFPSVVRMYWGGRPYFRTGEPPAGPEPERMIVALNPNGAVGMFPPGAEGPERPESPRRGAPGAAPGP